MGASHVAKKAEKKRRDLFRPARSLRGERAVLAQRLGVPLVAWWGPWLLSNVPHTEDVTVVTFDPFPASKYSMGELDQARSPLAV